MKSQSLPCLLHRHQGKTVIRDAQELKVKETNRIDTVVNELTTLGARYKATEDGMIIQGNNKLTRWNSFKSWRPSHRNDACDCRVNM